MKRILGAACLAAATAVGAADTGDLWEVTTQMNMAGMPPGMGGGTRQVCSEKGDPKKAMNRDDGKCKVTDFKESGNRIQMTVQCPEGTGTLDNTFNAARTEYKGTMKMTSKQGDMTMNMQGRKIGSCDLAASKTQQNAQADQYKAQTAGIMAQMEAGNQQQAAVCKTAPENMQISALGIYAQCDTQPGYCEAMAQSPATASAAKACTASAQEYCAKYKATRENFLKASRDAQQAEKLCKVSNAQLKTSFCAQASKADDLAFLASQCPVEAKPIAQANCTGRSFTSQIRDKYTDFCTTYLSHAKIDQPASTPVAPTSTSATQDAAKAATDAALNKLKGLFGR